MGVPHTANALIEGGLLAVEAALALQPHQQPTALLVEGPSSFSCNVPYQPLGVTLLRWRMLLTCSWRVRDGVPLQPAAWFAWRAHRLCSPMLHAHPIHMSNLCEAGARASRC